MSYEIGSVVNLDHLNKNRKTTSAQSAGQFLCDIGTHFKLIATEAGYRTARQIPVAFA